MSHELREGAKIASFVPKDNRYAFRAGAKGVVSLTISDQPGQMGMVPWIRVEQDNGTITMFNCALLEYVELLPVED